VNVGVAISTHNRRHMLERCISEWRKFHHGPLVVVDDGSANPVPVGENYENVWHPTNLGIASAKNAGLAWLEKLSVEHVFLADDDTWPTRPDWADQFIRSPEPFLIHGFETAPSHWRTTAKARGDMLEWDKPRGCLMYVHAPSVLPVVGGLHTAFGKHGGEHGDWAERIHAAGLTSAPHLSFGDSPFYCADEDTRGISSVEYAQQWRHIDPQRLPLYAEYRATDIPVLVPRRNDHGHRDHLWRWTQDTYWRKQRGFRVVEGHHVEGPFNRSLALNLASDIAGNWDVAVIADSDAWVPPEQLAEAVTLARKTNRLVAAFTEVHEVGEKDTAELLSGNVITTPAAERVRTRPLETQSVMLAVTRNCFEQVRGFDPKHVGWGGEDNSFWAACAIATGEPLRVDGPAYTLWHQPATREHQPRNAQRFGQYRKARTIADIHRLRAS
jgi:glycosyltransferase involved in cell wall biosynthesis